MWETFYQTIRSHSQEHSIYNKRLREHLNSHIDILLKIFQETAQNSVLSLNTTLVLRHYIAASTNSEDFHALAIIRKAFINFRSYFLKEEMISCTRKETRLPKKKKFLGLTAASGGLHGGLHFVLGTATVYIFVVCQQRLATSH